MDLPPRTDARFWERYRDDDRALRVRHAIAGCVLTLIFMPAGSTLELFIYPQHLWDFMGVRWLADLAVLPILLLLFTAFGRRHIGVLGALWPMMPAIAISWMVAMSEGAASPYYAGLNLVIIVACTLMPYTLADALFVCLSTLGFYVAGVAIHHGLLAGSRPPELRDLFGNCYFIALTGVITCTACHYFARRRVEEFLLRDRLDAQKREIADSYARLSELDRQRAEFFANISHELRTPLTCILAPLNDLLTSQQPLPPQAAEALGLARDNGFRLLKLINDLLELVRLDYRRGELHPEEVAVEEFVPGLVGSVRYLAEAGGIALDCAGEPGPHPLRTDPARLEKVLLNLLTNALKFTPAGGRIAVSWRRAQDAVEIAVADTGRGIPPEHLPRIFDRFHQVDGSSTRRHQGVGIGLALVRELVEEQGGTVRVESRPGAGSTFTIALPHRAAAGDAAGSGEGGEAAEPDPISTVHRLAERRGALALAGPEPAPVAAPAGSATVLVVDDEPDMRRYLVGLLAGHQRVLQAADGPSGLEAARRERPDLILLDMMLPGMDGLQVCAALRREQPSGGPKIIMLTARPDEETRLSALAEGADDFLTKPFGSVELRTRIGNLLRTAALQRELERRVAELDASLARLKQAESQLVQSEKMGALGRMSAGLLHEVNNPLNYALVALRAARARLPADAAPLREMLDDSEEGMKRIATIIGDLRIFAYPAAGGAGEEADPAAITALALRLCAQDLAGIAVAHEPAPGLRVRGSATQLSHVLVNLLNNAARAVRERPGAGRIAVACRAAGDRALLTVRDDGVGIPAAVLPRIFEPFFTTRPVGQGMGLGLSICATIAANHGGALTASSEPGVRTEFTLSLPLARAATASANQETAP